MSLSRLCLAIATACATPALAQTSLISDIPSERGGRFTGVAAGDALGTAIEAIGDINGDGRADLAISAPGTDRGGTQNVGRVYVVFGSANPPATLDISTLNGSNGFAINSGTFLEANSALGIEVSAAGDVNNDGLDDMLIGSNRGGLANNRQGRAYVIYGRSSAFPASVDVDSLVASGSPATGFTLTGEANGDGFGGAVGGGGDVNGDGFDDLIIGASSASSTNGRAYVVYGRATFPNSFSVSGLTAGSGTTLTPGNNGDQLGTSVDIGGDLNNDGRAEILVAAFSADSNFPTVQDNVGKVYVIFGSTNPPASFAVETLSGLDGFKLIGQTANSGTGTPSTFAGDVNGDGLQDVLIGAADAGTGAAGAVYVVYGAVGGFSNEIFLGTLNGSDGYVLTGAAAGDAAGFDVAALGDLNSDGRSDFILSAPDADPAGLNRAGKIYVVYGQETTPAAISLSTLETGATPGEVFRGTTADFRPETVGAALRYNGDNLPDFTIGAAAANGAAGDAYVVFRARDRVFGNGFE